jgi:hypothetical protein
MSSHTQIGPIHIFRGTAEMVTPERKDGASYMCSTKIRLPIQFTDRSSISTTVYSSDSPFLCYATFASPANDEACKAAFSARSVIASWTVEVQMLGEETHIMVYAVNTSKAPIPYAYFCDYIVIGDV